MPDIYLCISGPGLGRLNEFDCAYCPDPVVNIVLLTLILLMIFAVAAFGVMSAQEVCKRGIVF